jgi:predicted PurR-regulated permease PerM
VLVPIVVGWLWGETHMPGAQGLPVPGDQDIPASNDPALPVSNDAALPVSGTTSVANVIASRDRELFAMVLRLGLLCALIYLSFTLTQLFIPVVIWSVILAVTLYPVFAWIADHLGGRRGWAAFLTTAISLLVLIGPTAWFGFGLVQGLRALAEQAASGLLNVPAPPESIRAWPLIGDQIYQIWTLASTNLTSAFLKIAPEFKPVATPLIGKLGGATSELLQFFAALVIAGFLYSPGPSLVNTLKAVSLRYVPNRSEDFIELAGATIRAVARGVIGISLVQAMLAGIGFAVAGIPGVSLLVILILIFSVVQIGPSIIIIPAVIWSWFTMDTMPALIFTAYILPVNFLDTLLKPLVMTRGLNTPMLVILVGLLGGTLAYGIVGLFIGPIVLAVAWELLVAWIREHQVAAGPVDP